MENESKTSWFLSHKYRYRRLWGWGLSSALRRTGTVPQRTSGCNPVGVLAHAAHSRTWTDSGRKEDTDIIIFEDDRTGIILYWEYGESRGGKMFYYVTLSYYDKNLSDKQFQKEQDEL